MSVTNDRSVSRGRDLASVGRGGAGNIVKEDSASKGIDRAIDGDERGRDVEPRVTTTSHAGRGGQGNIRSPSREPKTDAEVREYEQEVLRKNREKREANVSYGRGGSGNISQSRSRSRDPVTIAGRGGLGNIFDGARHPHNNAELDVLDEDERAIYEVKRHQHHDLASHGRGDRGNINEADIQQPTSTAPAAAYEGARLVGRGGPGNAV